MVDEDKVNNSYRWPKYDDTVQITEIREGKYKMESGDGWVHLVTEEELQERIDSGEWYQIA